MLKTDEIRLRHILDSAHAAEDFAKGLTRQDLDNDRRTVFALLRCIEVIGEATNALSEDFKTGHPEIPWREIVAMRNRLIHAYFDIDLDIVWSAVTNNIPFLIRVADAALAKDCDGP